MIRRALIGGLAVVVLAVGAFFGYGYWTRRGAPAFSEGGGFGAASTETATPSPRVKGATEGSRAPERPAEPARRSVPATNAPTQAAEQGRPIDLPEFGSYAFAGEGREEVRFGPTSACSWDIDDVALEVKPDDDRVVFDWTYSSQRMERLLFDYEPRSVHLTFAGSAVTCVGVRRTSEERYRPPAVWIKAPLEVGDSWRQDSTAGERHETGRTRVLRTERVTVPAGSFIAYVVRSNITLSGSEEGELESTHWFVPDLGLSVMKHLEADVVSGSAHYTSDYTLRLASLPGG